MKRFGVCIYILVLSVLALFLSGYKFGIGDQIIHIPYIKSQLNPELYSNDLFLKFLTGKPTLFWDIFLPFFRIFRLEYGMFYLQLFSLFLFLYSMYSFVKTVSGNSLAAYLAPLLSIVPKYSFGYSALFVFDHFIPRNFTIGLILIATALYLKNSKKLSYFMLGFTCILHILSVLPILITVLINDLINLSKNKITDFLWYIVVFALGASLLVIKLPSFEQKNSVNSNTKLEFAEYYSAVLKPFYTSQTKEGYIFLINAFCIVIFSVIWLYTEKYIKPETRKFLILTAILSLLLVLVSVFAEKLLKEPLLIQLQFGRSGVYSVLVFIIFLACALSELWQRSKDYVLFLLACVVSALLPLISPLFLLVLVKDKVTKNPLKILVCIFLTLAISINEYTFGPLRLTINKISIFPEGSENMKAQEWIRDHTDKHAIILAPYYIGGYTESDFRIVTERTNILTNADIVETLLNVTMLSSTKDKLTDLTGDQYEYIIHNRKLFDYYALKEPYHKALQDNLEYLKNKYSLDYVVFEADYDLPNSFKVYENSRFKIYKVS